MSYVKQLENDKINGLFTELIVDDNCFLFSPFSHSIHLTNNAAAKNDDGPSGIFTYFKPPILVYKLKARLFA